MIYVAIYTLHGSQYARRGMTDTRRQFGNVHFRHAFVSGNIDYHIIFSEMQYIVTQFGDIAYSVRHYRVVFFAILV